MFTTARFVLQSWAKLVHYTPSYPISLRLILILSSFQRPGLAAGSHFLGLSTDTLYKFLFRFTCHLPLPPHYPWFDHPNVISWQVPIAKLLLMWFPPFSCYLFLLLASKCVPQHPIRQHPQPVPFHERDRPISDPHKTAGQIIVPYTLFFFFFFFFFFFNRRYSPWWVLACFTMYTLLSYIFYNIPEDILGQSVTAWLQLVCSALRRKYSSDLLKLFPDVRSVPDFTRIQQLS